MTAHPNSLCPSGQYLGPDLIGAVHLQHTNPGMSHMGQMHVPDLVQDPEAVAAMLMEGPGAKVGLHPGMASGFGPYFDAEVVHKLQSHPAWDMQVCSMVLARCKRCSWTSSIPVSGSAPLHQVLDMPACGQITVQLSLNCPHSGTSSTSQGELLMCQAGFVVLSLIIAVTWSEVPTCSRNGMVADHLPDCTELA